MVISKVDGDEYAVFGGLSNFTGTVCWPSRAMRARISGIVRTGVPSNSRMTSPGWTPAFSAWRRSLASYQDRKHGTHRRSRHDLSNNDTLFVWRATQNSTRVANSHHFEANVWSCDLLALLYRDL